MTLCQSHIKDLQSTVVATEAEVSLSSTSFQNSSSTETRQSTPSWIGPELSDRTCLSAVEAPAVLVELNAGTKRERVHLCFNRTYYIKVAF